MNLNFFPTLSQDSGGGGVDGGGANGTDRSSMEDRGGQRNASPPPDVRARHELQTVLAMQRDVGWKDANRRIPRARSAEAEGDEKIDAKGGPGGDVGDRTRSDGNVVSVGDGDREPLTEEEVDLALEGLDAAERLERSGSDLERALRLYEVSLEVLVRALGGGMPPGYDVPFVRGRAADALTRAEGLKANLAKRRQRRQGSTGSGAGEGGSGGGGGGNARGSVGGAGNVLSSLLNYPRSSSKKSVTAAQNQPPTYAASNHASSANRAGPAKTGAAGTTRRRSTGRPAAAATADIATYYPDRNRTGARTRTTSRAAGAAAAADSTPTHAPRRVAVRVGDDELTKVVKTEMYVDLLNSSGATHWSDVAGLREAKRSLQEAVILPLLRPDLYTGLRSPPRGILLYGPPGTGKTMLARAAACESRCNFFACSASGLTSKWVGEGEKLVRALFRSAREVAPSIIFFDEIDSLLSTRKSDEHEASRRFKTEFMVQVDGVLSGGSAAAAGGRRGREDELAHHVLVLGCSNCPWDLDDAVVRRFPRRIYVPLPDPDARRAMLTSMLDKSDRHSLSKKQVDQLVTMTEGYSCSDLKAVGSEAAFGPLRDVGDMDAVRNVRRGDVRPMNLGDFREALRNNRRSVGAALLKKYDEWEKEQSGGGG